MSTFPYVIIDDFLPADVHADLIRHTLDSRDGFTPSGVYTASGDVMAKEDLRKSWICDEGLGPVKKPFREAVHARFAELLAGLSMQPFEIHGTELQLVAHRHGSFFRAHFDTLTQGSRGDSKSNRALTLVYYFHARPDGFAGGEIVLLPLGKGERTVIEPRDNRLLAFASLAPHEVLPVVCPDDSFENARFAVNCWLHAPRARMAPA